MANESLTSKEVERDFRAEAQLNQLRRRHLCRGGNKVADPVTETATTKAVALVSTEPDTNYGVVLVPNWDTRYWVTSKTATGFTANFSTAAPANASIDWMVFRS